MAAILEHLEALGWGWVSLFMALDVLALACAILAVAGRTRRRALCAPLLSAGATLASLATTGVAAVARLSSANAATATSVDPSQTARVLAEGISVAMNGAALGIVCTLLAGLAATVCLVACLMHPSGRQAERR